MEQSSTVKCDTPKPALGGLPADSVARIDDARLVAADRDSANWLTYGRTYSEQRFSPAADSTFARTTR